MTMGDSFGESGEARSFRAESVTKLLSILMCSDKYVRRSPSIREGKNSTYMVSTENNVTPRS